MLSIDEELALLRAENDRLRDEQGKSMVRAIPPKNSAVRAEVFVDPSNKSPVSTSERRFILDEGAHFVDSKIACLRKDTARQMRAFELLSASLARKDYRLP